MVISRMTGETMTRNRDEDSCPGALTLHRAADGALARVRLPGGAITAAQLAALARISTEFASPALELTSRGNIQIRGIPDTAAATSAVADAIADAGLLPSPTHERVRNIVASPLSGRSGGLADVRHSVIALDRAIQAEPVLAALPGRFLFAVDDGRGDVTNLAADAGVQFVDADSAALLLAGRDTGVRLPAADVVAALIDVAVRFVAARGTAWRVAELADTGALLAGAAPVPDVAAGAAPVPDVAAGAAPVPGGVGRPPVGWIEQNDGRIALGAAVPLGVLQARVAEFLAAIEAPLVITPWRSVLVCDLDEGVADVALRVLAPMDLVFDETSPWLSVSACTGSPGCEHSAADVRADAALAVRTPSRVHRHFVGCERACGSPPAGEVLVATDDGYQRRVRD